MNNFTLCLMNESSYTTDYVPFQIFICLDNSDDMNRKLNIDYFFNKKPDNYFKNGQDGRWRLIKECKYV